MSDSATTTGASRAVTGPADAAGAGADHPGLPGRRERPQGGGGVVVRLVAGVRPGRGEQHGPVRGDRRGALPLGAAGQPPGRLDAGRVDLPQRPGPAHALGVQRLDTGDQPPPVRRQGEAGEARQRLKSREVGVRVGLGDRPSAVAGGGGRLGSRTGGSRGIAHRAVQGGRVGHGPVGRRHVGQPGTSGPPRARRLPVGAFRRLRPWPSRCRWTARR